MQTCDNEQFQKQTLEALRLGLCLTPRVVRDSHGAYDCEEFVPHLIRALIASCEGFANNPPSAKLAQKAADMAVACLKSGDDNFSRSIALALLDIFAPSIPNAEFFFDQNGTSGITDFLRQPTFVVALKEDANAASTFADGRVRRPTLLGASSGFANSENTPSGAGILSSFLQAGNPVSGGHRCDMCDETIEGIRGTARFVTMWICAPNVVLVVGLLDRYSNKVIELRILSKELFSLKQLLLVRRLFTKRK